MKSFIYASRRARWAPYVFVLACGLFASTFVRCACAPAPVYDAAGTARRPLVIINGQTQQLPTADYVSSVGGVSTNATAPAAGDLQTTTATVSSTTTMAGPIKRTGEISPPAFVSANNWNPTGLDTASVVNITLSSTGGITGMMAQPTGTEITLRNVGAPNVTISANSASSDPANRFNVGSTLTIKTGGSMTFRYTGSDWVMVGVGFGSTLVVPVLQVSTNGTIGGMIYGVQQYTTTGTSNDVVLNSSATVFQYLGAGTATLTGFFGCSDGRMLVIQNLTSNTITLPNQSGLSTVGKKLKNPGGADLVLSGVGATAMYICDGSSPSWQLVSIASTTNAIPTTFSSTTNKGTIVLAAGTGTATVNTGAVCTCTDTTATNVVQCAVSGTTLTATGTGTDTIAYHCF